MGHATQLTAAYWTSLFWFSFTIGRLVSIPITARVRPRTLLYGGLVGGERFVSLVLLWPGSASVLTVGIVGAGLCMSYIFPVMLTWAGAAYDHTGFVTSWFFIGASAGGMFFPWFIGQLFESSGPRITMVTTLVCLVLGLAMFAVLMVYTGKPRNKT